MSERPQFAPQSDWEPIHLPIKIGQRDTVFAGPDGQPRLYMRLYRRKGDGALVGRVWFDRSLHGPPLRVHGGLVAYVLDEAMGSACWLAGHPCVAGEIGCRFEQMVPVEEALLLEGQVTEVLPRKVKVVASLSNAQGVVLARGTGTFVRLNAERLAQFSQLMGENLDPNDSAKIKTPRHSAD